MSEELKPCPFCGTPDPEYDNCDHGSSQWYSCRGCPVSVKVAYREDLAAAWNRRAPSPSVGADGLPELPQCYTRRWINAPFQDVELFTADQMRAYALAALASRPMGDVGADATPAQIEAAIEAWFLSDADSFEARMRAAIDAARTAGTADTAAGGV